MAKIDTLKFEINGVTYESNVNVGKSGIFKTDLHWEVRQAIGYRGSLEAQSKDGLIGPILKAYHDYLDSKKEFHLYIEIRYAASKSFAKYKNGNVMFPYHGSKFRPSDTWTNASQLHFGFDVYCKETTSTGLEIWHRTEKATRETSEKDHVIDGYLVGSVTHSVNGTLIPYSERSMETLAKAEEGLRSISEILYGLLSQEEDVISNILNDGRLMLGK